MEMFRMTFQLNLDYIIIESDDKIKMREFVPQRKMTRTIRRINRIMKQNEHVNDFLPHWVTDDYLSSLHENKERQDAKLNVKDIPDADDCSERHRVKMAAVHEELLVITKSKAQSKKKREERAAKKRESSDQDHGELQKMQHALSVEDRDDFFIPRQLFLFSIDTFKASPQNECPTTERDPDIRESRPSDSTVGETVNQGKGRRSWGKRILRLFGFEH